MKNLIKCFMFMLSILTMDVATALGDTFQSFFFSNDCGVLATAGVFVPGHTGAVMVSGHVCQTKDCEAILYGKIMLCESKDCQALLQHINPGVVSAAHGSERFECVSNMCRAIVERKVELCGDNRFCRAMLTGDDSLCQLKNMYQHNRENYELG